MLLESLLVVVPALAVGNWYRKDRWDREGICYHPWSDSSFPNPTIQYNGNKWSKNSKLKRMFKKTKKQWLKVDNFNYPFNYKKLISPFKFVIHRNAQIYIDPLKLTGTVVMIAPMGGGKTVTMESLINQDWYSRALINEEKGGDLVKRWFNPRKDYILNLYDKRSHVWDVLSEDIEVVAFFMQNILASVVGDQPSFFTNDAKQRYKKIAMLTIEKKTAMEKWDYFFEQLNIMFDQVKKGDQESAQDVISTMEQALEMLKLIRFQLQCGKKSFTINDFFKKKNQNKIFMVNVDKYSEVLKLYFGAFTACFAKMNLSQPDTKTDLTFYLLDEYLNLKMGDEAKLLLHTKVRSKGGCLICAMQALPSDDKTKDLITSSAYAYYIFSVKNVETRRYFDEQVGEYSYLVRKKLNDRIEEREVTKKILDWSEMDKLSRDNQHVMYIPSEGALFVGKSDFVDMPNTHQDFIRDENIDKFYQSLNEEYLQETNTKSATKSAAEEYAKKFSKKS